MAALPTNSRWMSLTIASSVKVAIMALPSKVLVAATYSATGLEEICSMDCSLLAGSGLNQPLADGWNLSIPR
jgi:hypothetical protein